MRRDSRAGPPRRRCSSSARENVEARETLRLASTSRSESSTGQAWWSGTRRRRSPGEWRWCANVVAKTSMGRRCIGSEGVPLRKSGSRGHPSLCTPFPDAVRGPRAAPRVPLTQQHRGPRLWQTPRRNGPFRQQEPTLAPRRVARRGFCYVPGGGALRLGEVVAHLAGRRVGQLRQGSAFAPGASRYFGAAPTPCSARQGLFRRAHLRGTSRHGDRRDPRRGVRRLAHRPPRLARGHRHVPRPLTCSNIAFLTPACEHESRLPPDGAR